MNYENVVKVLHGSPLHQLALPATGGTQTSKAPKQKVPKKAATATAAQPAVPGPLEAAQPAKTKVPCALHAAGYCRLRGAEITTLGNQVQRHRGSKSVTTRKARIRGGVRPPRVLASSPEKASSPAKERTRVKARGRKETTRALRVALELRQQCLRQHQP